MHKAGAHLGRSASSGSMAAGRLIPTILCILVGCLLVVQIVFALKFLNDSFPNLSTYADTEHYLNLAGGRTVPEIRGVLYPLFLRGLTRVSEVNLHRLAYAVQVALTGLASLYFCFALLKTAAGDRFARPSVPRWLWVMVPVTMLADPLSLHFDLAVMPDSLASSMVLVFVGSLVLILSRRGGRRLSAHALLCTVAFTGMALARREKLIIGGVLLAITLVYLIVAHFRRRGTELRLMLLGIILAVAVVGSLASVAIDRSVPKRERGRITFINARLLLANRLSWEVLDRIYDRLSAETRQSIPPPLAREIVAKRRNLNLFMTELLEEDRERANRILHDMIRTSLARESGTVLRYVAEDFFLYLSASAGFYYQMFSRPARRQFTEWTLMHMKSQVGIEAGSVTYIDRYLAISALLLGCLVAAAAVCCLLARRRGIVLPPSAGVVAIVLLFHLLNVAVFAFVSCRFHIRYALPSHKLLLLICYTMLAAHIYGYGEPSGASAPTVT